MIIEYLTDHFFDIATTIFAFFIFRFEYKRLIVDKEQQYLDVFNDLNESIDSIYLHLDKYASIQNNLVKDRDLILEDVLKYASERKRYLKILETNSLTQIEKGLKELKTAWVNIKMHRSTLDNMMLRSVLEKKL